MNSAGDYNLIEFFELSENWHQLNKYCFEHITFSPTALLFHMKLENNICHVVCAYEMLASGVYYRARMCMTNICSDAL